MLCTLTVQDNTQKTRETAEVLCYIYVAMYIHDTM